MSPFLSKLLENSAFIVVEIVCVIIIGQYFYIKHQVDTQNTINNKSTEFQNTIGKIIKVEFIQKKISKVTQSSETYYSANAWVPEFS
jgi:hypothetical protein